MHRLFHDELFNPPYSIKKEIIDRDTAEIIYQFNCDIAYEMFKTKNEKLFMANDELKEILPDNDIKGMVKKSHGLFSYMRKKDNCTVEFVHNHVRDYFLCEKILREINNWYSDKEIDGYQIALKLGKLLKYTHFTNEVKLFIKEALQSNVYNYILIKCKDEPLSNVFDCFYKSGGIVEYAVNESNGYTYEKISYLVTNNSAYIYIA